MKQRPPRRHKPLYFSLRVESRDASIIDVKDLPMTRWHDTLDVLEQKGAIPKPTMRRTLAEMIEKRL